MRVRPGGSSAKPQVSTGAPAAERRCQRSAAAGFCDALLAHRQRGRGAALAHPPFGLLPGLLGLRRLLLWLIDRSREDRPLRSAFFLGWLCGLRLFRDRPWWIAEAFLVDAEDQGWMAPFAVLFLAGGLALFWGAAAAALSRLGGRRGHAGSWCSPACSRRFEWLRGHVLTGLPWDLPGETWKAGSAPSQAASLVGAYGLTWITLAVVAALAVLPGGPPGAGGRPRRRGELAGLYVFGAGRLAGAVPISPKAPIVRIVQADVARRTSTPRRSSTASSRATSP